MSQKFPSILMIMLCMRCRLGGAEKRYARVFEMLVAQPGAQHRLLINRAMLDLLQSAGILTHHDPYLIMLEPPFRRNVRSRWLRWLRPVAGILDALWYVWRCERAICRVKPEIVHPLLTGMYLSLPVLLLHPRTHHVMSAYTAQYYRDKHILGIGVGRTLQNHALHHCQAIDALSDPIRAGLIARGINGDKIQVAPGSFTDFSLCQPAARREKWIVFVARFVAHKNPLLLVAAIPYVLAHIPDAHFYFLGRGPLQPQLESRIRDLKVADHVTLHFEPHPTQILNRASIFVSLQDKENYPSQSLLEAMACGNAIIATDVGETWRLVDDENGVRIPPTAKALADAIVSLLKDPHLHQRGLASRRRVLSEHTPERFLTYITRLYQTINGEPHENTDPVATHR